MRYNRRRPVPKVRRPPRPGAWAVRLVDSAPIRDAIRRQYERARKDLQKARAELDRFNNKDKPFHGRWMARTFGARLTELRELHAKLESLQAFVERVEAEYMFGDHRSISQAYREVKKEEERRANAPRESEAEAEFETGTDAEREAREKEEREFRNSFEDQARRIFADAFGFDPDEMFEEDSLAGPRTQSADSRVKELYRSIVRRLHPDAGGERTPAQIELWHQTQQAYEEQDVDQLEVILATLEVEENGVASSSVSILQRIVGQFKSGLRSLKSMLRDARQDPAWNFSNLADTASLERKMESMLESDKRMMLAQLKALEAQKERWEAAAARPPKGRNRRQNGFPRHAEFPF